MDNNLLISKTLNDLSLRIKQRLEFIEFRLFWESRINRRDLVSVFSISIPQASADFAKYQDLAPQNMKYDKKGKFYFAAEDFKPVIFNPSSEQYLLRYIAVSWGVMKKERSFLGTLPPVSSVPTPWRRVDPLILKAVLGSIRDNRSLNIVYQSLSREGRLTRMISPHALGFDGFRWHCRAFCHIDLKFKDFILGRILQVVGSEDSTISPLNDVDWNKEVHVRIAASPELYLGHREIIEHEYGMENGESFIVVKKAMLTYLLNQLGFDRNDLTKISTQQHIAIINIDEVKDNLSQ